MYDISDGTVETLLSPSDPGETPICNTAYYYLLKLI